MPNPTRSRMGSPRRLAILPALVLPVLLTAACTGYGRADRPGSQLAFGVDMARQGLWNEALFRFGEAERNEPDNPRIQNNLGVAYEAQGKFEKALEHYQKALKIAPNSKETRANYARFVEFYQSFKAQEKKQSDSLLGRAKAAAGTAVKGETGAGAPPEGPSTKPSPSGPPDASRPNLAPLPTGAPQTPTPRTGPTDQPTPPTSPPA